MELGVVTSTANDVPRATGDDEPSPATSRRPHPHLTKLMFGIQWSAMRDSRAAVVGVDID
jgi:hypothetical protein